MKTCSQQGEFLQDRNVEDFTGLPTGTIRWLKPQSYEKDQVAWATIFPESADQSCDLFLAFLKERNTIAEECWRQKNKHIDPKSSKNITLITPVWEKIQCRLLQNSQNHKLLTWKARLCMANTLLLYLICMSTKPATNTHKGLVIHLRDKHLSLHRAQNLLLHPTKQL